MKFLLRRNRHILVPIAALVLTAFDAAAAPIVYQTIALSGQTAPGGAAAFTSFGTPVVNSNGDVAFLGGFLGGTGLWATGGGSLNQIARSGTAAPGTSANFQTITGTNSMVRLNDSGQVLYRGVLTGAGVTSSNNVGIWLHSASSSSLIARNGDPAPGTSGAQFGSSSSFSLNNDGDVAFEKSLTGSGVTTSNNSGIWSTASGSLALVAREGSPAPGTTANFRAFNAPILGDEGNLAFYAALSGSGVTTANDDSVWAQVGGVVSLVARGGDAAPGTSAQFADFSGAIVNSSGDMGLRANLSGSGVDGSNYAGIWSGPVGGLQLVARGGDTAPGTMAQFSPIDMRSPDLNASGHVAFFGGLIGSGVNSSNNAGIWSGQPGGLSLVARKGDIAPGTTNPFSFLGTPLLNSSGSVAFIGQVSGAGVSFANDMGFWATDLNGVLTKIVREGDLFDIGGGSFRTVQLIQGLSTDFNPYELSRPFNDVGMMAFALTFTDGSSGVFLSSFENAPNASAPAPGALALLVFGLAGLGFRRRN